MTRSIQVREYMSKPITVKQDISLAVASRVILKHRISGLVVVDDDNNLVGVLSELDCMQAFVTTVYNGGTPGAEIVKDVMTTEVAVNGPNEDIVTVAAEMLDRRHRRRPIIEDGKLIGQITCRQLLRAIKEFGG